MASESESSGGTTRRRVLAAAGGAAAAALAGGVGFHILKRRRRNVIFIISDAVRADSLDRKGPGGRELSRYISEAGRRGTVFQRCISGSSWTLPSVAGIMTSRNPIVTGEYYSEGYAAGATTFARELQAAGYFTAAVVKNPWLPAKTASGELMETVVRKGFEHYTVGGVRMEDNPLFAQGIGQEREFAAFAPAEAATGEAIEVLKTLRGRGDRRPFCLYLHYMNTHEPYSPSQGEMHLADEAAEAVEGVPDHLIYKVLRHRGAKRGEMRLAEEDWGLVARARALYDAAFASVDKAVGQLGEYLERTGEAEDTIFVFTSDHGEEFGEHGWFGHSVTLYQECIHVPLVVWGKGVERGKGSWGLARGVDIAPGILELTGLSAQGEMEGVGFGFDGSGAREAVSSTVSPALPKKLDTVSLSILDTSGVKLIEVRPAAGGEGEVKREVYDISEDVGEGEDLSGREGADGGLGRQLERYVRVAQARGAGTRLTVDDETEKELRSLGYFN